jgi:uncharacterized protein with gpF-like domain
MGLREDLLGLIGDEAKVDEVLKTVGGSMLPKDEYKKAKDEIKVLKDENEKAKLASMNSEELLKHKVEEAENKYREYGIKTNKLEAENAFVKAGLTREVYGDLLETVVSDDAEKTLSLVNKFIGVLSKEKESVESRTKENLLNQTKKPETSDNIEDKPVIIRKSF